MIGSVDERTKTIAEQEHAGRALLLSDAFRNAEALAEFLHQNYRATAKSLGVSGPLHHDHGWGDCYGRTKAYFRRRAAWLLTPYPAANGRGLDKD